MLKNITLTAENHLIEEARHKAVREKKTLNTLFRQWLAQYVQKKSLGDEYRKIMKKMRHIDLGGPYTREQLNERR